MNQSERVEEVHRLIEEARAYASTACTNWLDGNEHAHEAAQISLAHSTLAAVHIEVLQTAILDQK